VTADDPDEVGGPPGTPLGSPGDEPLQRENRILERRLRRLDANVRRLEEFQDANATLLSGLLRDLESERARSRSLLLNVLPRRIVDRLEAGETAIADRHPAVAVLLSDFVGFTGIATDLSPADLVAELNDLFGRFDAICDELGVEKIKTVGDAYLAVAGLDASGDQHELDPAAASAIAEAALRMINHVESRTSPRAAWRIRVGLHCGPVVAGIVGVTKFAYDVWGDTVNVASRLETTAEPGRIHVSEALAGRLAGRYALESRGPVELKGKGLMETFVLLGPRRDARSPGDSASA